MNRTLNLARQAVWGALGFLGLLFATAAHANDDLKGSLPVLKTLGVVPVQVQHVMDFPLEWQSPLKYITGNFARIVRETQRFRVLNDEVVTDLWNSASGRKELVDRFEMDAFLALAVTPKADVIHFVIRLIAPDLAENYLVEEETVSQMWLATSEESVIEGFLKDLAFRLINRLPVDVFVTSLQGPYITLSGGENQNIFPGDMVTLYDTKITSIHPANGAWLSFSQKKLGKARIIETKHLASVAEITTLSYEGALFLGSGAKIDALNSRVRFHRSAEVPLFRTTDSAVLITPKPLVDKATEKRPGPLVASAADMPLVSASKPAPAMEATAAQKPFIGDGALQKEPHPTAEGAADDAPIVAVQGEKQDQKENSIPTDAKFSDPLPVDAGSSEVKTEEQKANDFKAKNGSAAEAKPSEPGAKDDDAKNGGATDVKPADQNAKGDNTINGGAADASAEEKKAGEEDPKNDRSNGEGATTGSSPVKNGQEDIDDKEESPKKTLLDPLLHRFDEREAALSYHLLQVGSPATTSTKLPSWIINDFSARGRVHYANDICADYLGFLRLGPTANGYVSGLGVESRLLWGIPLDPAPLGVRKVRVGPLVHLESIGISGEKYGGADRLSIGVSGEIEGALAFGGDNRQEEASWRLNASFVPLAMGGVGITGNKKPIEAFSIFAIDGTLFFPKKPSNGFQWGAAAGVSAGSIKGGATSLSTSDLFVGVAFR